MAPFEDIIFKLALIFAGASILATIFLYFKQPIILAYIALGMLIGPWGAGVVKNPALIEHISHLGIILLMFLLGLHLHPQKLYKLLKETALITVGTCILFTLLIMLVTFFMALDLHLTSTEGWMLLGGLVAMVAWLVRLGMQRPPTDRLAEELEAEIPTDVPTHVAVFWLMISLIVLPASSHFLVEGAVSIARGLGVTDTVIGLTIVAFGTSLPELATSVVAALRKEMDISIGNLVGSNVFNIMSVLGAASLVRPIPIPGGFIESGLMIDYFVMMFTSFLPWLMMRRTYTVTRQGGLILLFCYVGYITYLIIKV